MLLFIFLPQFFFFQFDLRFDFSVAVLVWRVFLSVSLLWCLIISGTGGIINPQLASHLSLVTSAVSNWPELYLCDKSIWSLLHRVCKWPTLLYLYGSLPFIPAWFASCGYMSREAQGSRRVCSYDVPFSTEV